MSKEKTCSHSQVGLMRSQIFGNFLLSTFFLEFALFFLSFSPTKIAKLKNIETKEICWLGKGHGGRGVIQQFNPKISPA
jgi:hypothetical protein